MTCSRGVGGLVGSRHHDLCRGGQAATGGLGAAQALQIKSGFVACCAGLPASAPTRAGSNSRRAAPTPGLHAIPASPPVPHTHVAAHPHTFQDQKVQQKWLTTSSAPPAPA